jgi:hypothetical protein
MISNKQTLIMTLITSSLFSLAPPGLCFSQVLGMVGCGRKRMLLLWFAMEQSRNLDPSEALALKIVLQLLGPPERPGYLVSIGGFVMQLASTALLQCRDTWLRPGF